ncbi:hypothetical protein E2C01_057848 [Portunus trituberculatus]|uniref:Uncharacterized protein n=1 Tax=Portunus trituberculatus TaxID=210409 RepID=A0A5B7H282_PORTR|nr:hypothetical protein [Portunus trituberculatus]
MDAPGACRCSPRAPTAKHDTHLLVQDTERERRGKGGVTAAGRCVGERKSVNSICAAARRPVVQRWYTAGPATVPLEPRQLLHFRGLGGGIKN